MNEHLQKENKRLFISGLTPVGLRKCAGLQTRGSNIPVPSPVFGNLTILKLYHCKILSPHLTDSWSVSESVQNIAKLPWNSSLHTQLGLYAISFFLITVSLLFHYRSSSLKICGKHYPARGSLCFRTCHIHRLQTFYWMLHMETEGTKRCSRRPRTNPYSTE